MEGMSEQSELLRGEVEKFLVEVSSAYPVWHVVSIGIRAEGCLERFRNRNRSSIEMRMIRLKPRGPLGAKSGCEARRAMARVLVIDDDNGTRRMLCEVLTRAGHETIGAAKGRAGVARFRESRADVVIPQHALKRPPRAVHCC